MLNTNRDLEIQNEIHVMINRIAQELINEFGKGLQEALHLIRESNVEESLKKDRMGFHESPYNWAIIILTEHDDYDALEKYLH